MPAVLEGLYDPLTRQHTLASLTDQDLMLAALVQNETPIYPGTDELNAARNFAELWLHAESQYAKESIAQSSVRIVDPLKVGAAVAALLGWQGEANQWVYHLHEQQTAVSMMRAIFTALLTSRVSLLPRDNEWGPDALRQFSEVVDDPSVFLTFAQYPLPYSSRIAAVRLVQLKAVEECDALLESRAGASVGFIVARGASTEALRRHAEVLLHDEEHGDALLLGYIEGILERRDEE